MRILNGRGRRIIAFSLVAAALCACQAPRRAETPSGASVDATLARIDHIVIIYGENRSFDNLYGAFPGASGIAQADPMSTTQRDRNGQPLATLPPVWSGAGGQFDAAFGASLPNAPFAIDGPPANAPLSAPTRDLVHRYYQNMAQIDGGRNDRFVAYSDAGALTMGHYDGSKLAVWALAREFTLADHFFMGAFGGSYMNHIYLACACAATFANAPAAMRSKLGPDGALQQRADSPASALQGPPQWERDGVLTPDGYAINTIQSSYEPSGIAPAKDGDPRFADPAKHPLPPIEAASLGDRLNARNVSWAWYAGGWNQALTDSTQPGGSSRGVIYTNRPNSVDFQPHHQPFNYFAAYAPGTPARTLHLRDAADFLAAIDSGHLPQVSFYKPEGDLTQHSGYTDVASGDAHIAALVERIRHSPAWPSTLIIVTYDENGGYWDHVAPPTGEGWSDRWGPGTRIPTILISPLVRKGFVDHSIYDTGSIHRLINRRFGLEPLPGLRANMGDLTNALALP